MEALVTGPDSGFISHQLPDHQKNLLGSARQLLVAFCSLSGEVLPRRPRLPSQQQGMAAMAAALAAQGEEQGEIYGHVHQLLFTLKAFVYLSMSLLLCIILMSRYFVSIYSIMYRVCGKLIVLLFWFQRSSQVRVS
jgi:alkylhydroperoxidase/carboxymuconolactone decarboxylase family protein YurZ